MGLKKENGSSDLRAWRHRWRAARRLVRGVGCHCNIILQPLSAK